MENIILSPISIKDFREIISEEIKEAMKAKGPEKVLSETIELIDEKTLCKRLNVTRNTLVRWRRQSKIPFIKQGHVIRYDYSKVIETLEKKKRVR